MASCVFDKGDGTLRLLNKGASEWVLDISTHVHEQDGSKVPLTAEKKKELMMVVTEMASRGLRTLVRSPYVSLFPVLLLSRFHCLLVWDEHV